jgi:hypothetical protein
MQTCVTYSTGLPNKILFTSANSGAGMCFSKHSSKLLNSPEDIMEMRVVVAMGTRDGKELHTHTRVNGEVVVGGAALD